MSAPPWHCNEKSILMPMSSLVQMGAKLVQEEILVLVLPLWPSQTTLTM